MKAIFAGAFDPFTLGHRDIAERAASLFDEVIVAVADITGKTTASLDKRVDIARLSTADLNNVCVVPFCGLLTDFVKSQGDGVIVRGIRNSVDAEYEIDHASIYNSLSGADTVCFFTRAEFRHISSSVVRELVNLGGDISGYVSSKTLNAIKSIYSK